MVQARPSSRNLPPGSFGPNPSPWRAWPAVAEPWQNGFTDLAPDGFRYTALNAE